MSDSVFIIAAIVSMCSLFPRMFINIQVYNREFNKKDSWQDYNGRDHVMFMIMWWTKVKPENKTIARVSNVLGVIFLIAFFGAIVLGVITGKIKD